MTNIDDDDVERELRRYRPMGPPEDLRARVIAAATPRRSRWREWIPAAAVLIAALLFYTLAAREQQRVAARVTRAEDAELSEIVSVMIEASGGELVSREEVENWLRTRRAMAALINEELPQ